VAYRKLDFFPDPVREVVELLDRQRVNGGALFGAFAGAAPSSAALVGATASRFVGSFLSDGVVRAAFPLLTAGERAPSAPVVETHWTLPYALDGEVAAMRATYQRRRDLVCAALSDAGVEVTPPKGTIYVWAPTPPGFESAAAYCEHVLERAAVAISPGDAYGPSGEGFFRISLTTPEDRLLTALERIRWL
jgi:hypothetical protein